MTGEFQDVKVLLGAMLDRCKELRELVTKSMEEFAKVEVKIQDSDKKLDGTPAPVYPCTCFAPFKLLLIPFLCPFLPWCAFLSFFLVFLVVSVFFFMRVACLDFTFRWLTFAGFLCLLHIAPQSVSSRAARRRRWVSAAPCSRS